jgi:prevent-host-death family protein
MTKVFTAKNAKTLFGQVLEESKISPVEITKNGRTFAYMISAEKYNDLVHSKESRGSDPVELFCAGKISKEQAVRMMGMRDYSDLLIEIGERGLQLPKLPENEIIAMKNVFLNILKESGDE